MQNKPVALIIQWILALSLLTYGVLLGIVFYNVQSQRTHTLQTLEHAPVGIVLGKGVNAAGDENPCLYARVRAGANLYQAGKVDYLILSGGTDVDGSNEAAKMYAQALSMGLPARILIKENRSTSTYENLKFSAPLLGLLQESGLNHQPIKHLILVSEDYHLSRATWLAHARWPYMHIQTYAATQCEYAPIARPRALLREALAIVSNGIQGRY